MNRSAGLAVSLLLLFSAGVARGEAPARVAALMPSTDVATTARVRAELGAAGFELRLARPLSWPPSREEIEEIARKEQAIAGLALIPSEDGVEILIVDRVTGKTVVRVLASKPEDSEQDRMDLVAICTLETLRATLMEVSAPRHTRGEVAPPPAVQELVRPEPSRFSLRVSAAGYRSEAPAAGVALGLAATAALLPRLRLGLDGFVPLTRPALTGPEGRAELTLTLAGAFVEASLTDPLARVDVILGGGGWLGLLTLRGGADAPYVGSTVERTTLMPHVDLAARARVSRRIAALARLSGALATPKVNVRFAERDVATWGGPFVLGALTLEVGLD